MIISCRPIRRGTLATGLLACTLALTACNSGKPSPAAAPAPADSAAPVAATTAPAAPAASLTRVFEATQTGANGNSARQTMRMGTAVTPARAGGVDGHTLAEATCLPAVDAEHDLVVPYTMEMTNRNASLSLPPNFAVGYAFVFTKSDLPLDEAVTSVAFYGDGPKCTGATGDVMYGDSMILSLRLTANLAPSATAAVSGYFLLSAVVQPNFPDGDPAMVQHAYLSPQKESGGPEITIGSGSWHAITPAIGQITEGIPIAP